MAIFSPKDVIALAVDAEKGIPNSEVIEAFATLAREMAAQNAFGDADQCLESCEYSGYLMARSGDWAVYVPWHLASAFPGPETINGLVILAERIMLQGNGNIALSGSTVFAGKFAGLGDIDFAQYAFDDAEPFVSRVRDLTQRHSSAILARVKYSEEYLAPWDKLVAALKPFESLKDQASRLKFDFVDGETPFGLMPVSNIVLPSDPSSHSIAALDSRIAEFEAIEAQVKKWRNARSKSVAPDPAKQTQAEPVTEFASLVKFLVREKALARRMEVAIDTLMQQMEPMRLASIAHSTESIARLEAANKRILAALGTNQIESSGALNRYMSRIQEAYEALTKPFQFIETNFQKRLESVVSEFESAYGILNNFPNYNQIETERAIAGFGTLASYVRDYRPDAIFALNEGGGMVSDFIQEHLQLAVPIIHLHGTSSINVVGAPNLPNRILRPLILDDIARTGSTVINALSWIAERYPNSRPQAATMTASLQAIDTVGDDALLAPNITDDIAVRLPYDSRAGFTVERSTSNAVYIFGARASGLNRRLVIPVETVEKVAAERTHSLETT